MKLCFESVFKWIIYQFLQAIIFLQLSILNNKLLKQKMLVYLFLDIFGYVFQYKNRVLKKVGRKLYKLDLRMVDYNVFSSW